MQIWKKRYKKNHDIVSRKVANQFILVPVRHSIGDLDSVYTLNEVGARIWELIQQTTALLDIRDKIIDEFQASPEEVGKDIEEFIKQLQKIGALEEV